MTRMGVLVLFVLLMAFSLCFAQEKKPATEELTHTEKITNDLSVRYSDSMVNVPDCKELLDLIIQEVKNKAGTTLGQIDVAAEPKLFTSGKKYFKIHIRTERKVLVERNGQKVFTTGKVYEFQMGVIPPEKPDQPTSKKDLDQYRPSISQNIITILNGGGGDDK